MGYYNNSTGHPQTLLSTRSIIAKGNYALIEPDGLVKNVVPDFENCDLTILSSPKLGASFVDYLLNVNHGGRNLAGIGGGALELFFYVMEGSVKIWNDDKCEILSAGGYIFSPQGKKLYFENTSDSTAKCFLYKRIYNQLPNIAAHTVVGNICDVPWVNFEGMENVQMRDFLPAKEDLGFDMNFHILRFKAGGSHGYIETHYQEHGAYIYSGQGMYNLDGNWIPVKKGDYIFMAAYCPQACYGISDNEDFAYFYSKDCNRDADL